MVANLLARFLDATPDMTQVRFSQESGVPQSEISKYARGVRTPAVPTAVRIHLASKGKVPVTFWYPELADVLNQLLKQHRAA